ETICDELHIERPQNASIKLLVDRLNHYLLESNAAGRKTVQKIDEAQKLSVDVLEQLRLLTNLETNRYKLLQIVLLGQPELLQILGQQEMRQLSQRVTARFHLGPLAPGEIGAYVQHRLEIAGCQRRLFQEQLNKPLWQLTGGVPRLLNLVCDRALLGAYAQDQQTVDLRILRQAASEVLGPIPQRRSSRPALVAVAAVLLGGLLGGLLWYGQKTVLPLVDLAARDTTTMVTIPAPAGEITEAADTTEAGSSPGENPAIADVTEASQAPAAVATEEPAVVTEPDWPQTWPADFAMGRSPAEAFADLAALWGLADFPLRKDYCSLAGDRGYACLARQDSLTTLRQINRPAMLTLYDDEGLPFYVVLARLHAESALFIAGDDQRELALTAIAPRWFGSYLVLWQPPAIGQRLLKPGQGGEAVAWLAAQLDALGIYQQSGEERVLAGTLLGAFKRFQFSRGLTPDGVLGPMSLIQLHTALGREGPRLAEDGAE
ncbi:MAG: AAA family ATPase, partial [Desulfuromonadales bacterium]